VGVPISLILIAVGAILTFAVNQRSNATVDIDVVGWILMIVGAVGLLLSLLLWDRLGPGYWGNAGRGSYPAGAAYPRRRRRVVEEDAPAPPPDAPPPY
jgi:hypothetical protein